ncbi:MAG: hypothetical protein Q9169_004179 [Polycauliona sp. 2 TL-2023]
MTTPNPEMESSPPSTRAISQYSTTSDKLAQRAAILNYDTNPQSWYTWLSTRLPINTAASILEVGSGTGDLWRHIPLPSSSQPQTITLTDFSPAMCCKLRDLIPSLQQHSNTTTSSSSLPHRVFTVKQCDATSLPFESSSFDLVIANHMLYHLDSPSAALSEFARVLRPQGRVCITLNGRDHIAELLSLGASIGRPSPIVDAARVTAENARELLLKEKENENENGGFRDVSEERFPGGFEVRDVDAVVGYLGSWGQEEMTEGQVRDVRGFVEGRMREEVGGGGVFRVRKHMVLFSAVKV